MRHDTVESTLYKGVINLHVTITFILAQNIQHLNAH